MVGVCVYHDHTGIVKHMSKKQVVQDVPRRPAAHQVAGNAIMLRPEPNCTSAMWS